MSAQPDSLPPRMPPMAITAYTATTALGHGVAAQIQALQSEASGLAKCNFDTCALDCWTGAVDGLDRPLPTSLYEWECRNNRLAQLGLLQDNFAGAASKLRARLGADRVGVFMGTSTAGIHHTELAYRELDPTKKGLPKWHSHRHTQSSFSIAEFVAAALQLSGPTIAVSTACSSSAKVFAAAYRSIHAGYCDAAIVGGVDSLCLTTLYGFNALQLVSNDVCRPADATRSGISIGEAAGFAILERDADSAAYLLGYGESSDAHHMSSPDPNGAGAVASMSAALARAGLSSGDIDYVNLHGTGTIANDAAEDKAICAVLVPETSCSSTKGWTGHTLGAAGIVESVVSLLCISNSIAPRSLNTRVKDPMLRANILMANEHKPIRRVMSNSFGFGGSNCSLVFGARP
jgi:3-oxoacyl-[acyl-carrier-protein] synthase I